MQEYIASEWGSRVRAMEKQLQEHVDYIDELRGRLGQSLKEQASRERMMKAEEARVSILKKNYFVNYIICR